MVVAAGWWLPDKATLLSAGPTELGTTSQTETGVGTGKKRVWNGLQTFPDMLAVNTVSYANLATLAMPALARSGVSDACMHVRSDAPVNRNSFRPGVHSCAQPAMCVLSWRRLKLRGGGWW